MPTIEKTDQRLKVQFIHEGDYGPQRVRHKTLTVWMVDGHECVKQMGRGCWLWYKLYMKTAVATVFTNVHDPRYRIVHKVPR